MYSVPDVSAVHLQLQIKTPSLAAFILIKLKIKTAAERSPISE
jgi:hypothetical protein